LLHASKFHDGAILAHSLADSFIALFVCEINAAGVCRNANVIGDKDQDRVRIWVFAVLFDCAELLFIRAASKQRLHSTNEKNLEGGHQRSGLSAVQNLNQISFRKIKLK